SQTLAHSAGTGIGCQAPVVVVAPMRRFQPPLTLTSAHRFMRSQFRTVHGTTHATAIAVTATTAPSRWRQAAWPETANAPSTGASARHWGRTRVAIPTARPAPARWTSRRLLASSSGSAPWGRAVATRDAAMTSKAAVAPSVIKAAVYGTSAG